MRMVSVSVIAVNMTTKFHTPASQHVASMDMHELMEARNIRILLSPFTGK